MAARERTDGGVGRHVVHGEAVVAGQLHPHAHLQVGEPRADGDVRQRLDDLVERPRQQQRTDLLAAVVHDAARQTTEVAHLDPGRVFRRRDDLDEVTGEVADQGHLLGERVEAGEDQYADLAHADRRVGARVHGFGDDVRFEDPRPTGPHLARPAVDLGEAVVVVDRCPPGLCEHGLPARGHVTAEEVHPPDRARREVEAVGDQVCRERLDHPLGAAHHTHPAVDAWQVVCRVEHLPCLARLGLVMDAHGHDVGARGHRREGAVVGVAEHQVHGP